MSTSDEIIYISESEILLTALDLMDDFSAKAEQIEQTIDAFLSSKFDREDAFITNLQAIDAITQIQGDIRSLIEQLKLLQESSSDQRTMNLQLILGKLKLEISRFKLRTRSSFCTCSENVKGNSDHVSQEVELF